MNHIEDMAELYALGLLGESEGARIRKHIMRCRVCRYAVVQAQDVVAAVAQEVPQLEPSSALRQRLLDSSRPTASARTRPSFGWFTAGLATGIAAAALLLLPARMSIQQSASQNDLALSTIVQSHFTHVPFTALSAKAPQGKVLYAKHAAWLYIIVHAPRPGTQVALEGPGGTKYLGALPIFGENGTLFVRDRGLFHTVVLLREGRVVSRATPTKSP